ncbi:tetratricopeptide repeat protein [Candidatus Bodocaedibacter vickermanii]|uniref:Tetratricopeptide repeat-containing protein n=1 Tax=Candidatus Bodocaedibacter vickermanii TaxID=2741701 RepID=A0A7L9RVL3_9PROT|nr:tetratricopeptide repeat-containing protein [Candidatus Paracaedibacteraceae bacterium 'Lake Konstanz']
MQKYRLIDLFSYQADLSTLNNINITDREVDIIACVMNRRISDPSIATQLKINKRTVETHIRNITQKLRCSTQRIREVVENEEKLDIFLQHYNTLLLSNRFQLTLDKIQTLASYNQTTYIFYHMEESVRDVLNKIRPFLNYVGIEFVIALFNDQAVMDVQDQSSCVLIFTDKDSAGLSDTFKGKCLNYEQFPTLFGFILEVIKQIIGNERVANAVDVFNKKTDTEYVRFANESSQVLEKPLQETSIHFIYRTLNYWRQMRWVSVAAVLCLGIMAWVGIAHLSANEKVRSEFYIPKPHLLLQRSALLLKIQHKLYEPLSKSNISTLVISGVGGAGKTMLAKRIGQQHKGVVWEFNAETKTTLNESTKDFAFALANSNEDMAKLKFIFSLSDVKEQNKQMCMFVRNKLAQKPNWLLIFDNVESFSDIKSYVPSDPAVWGSGSVIITSRNSNFSVIDPDNIIKIDALSPAESIELFTHLKYPNVQISKKERKEIEEFIKKIPAFPLDIVIAANFLRNSPQLEYDQYLDQLNNNTFQMDQSDLFKASSDYTQTRHDIISVSLQRLLSNETFRDSMVLIGLLDSQNIPKHILQRVADSASVERMIYELKKYSLITSESKVNDVGVFSMHRSIHSNLRNYVFNQFKQEEREQKLQKALETFELYANEMVDSSNYPVIYSLVSHAENILTHQMSDFFQAIANATYVNLLSAVPAHTVKVIPLLEKSLNVLARYPIQNNQDSLRIARVLSTLGDRYRSLCLYPKAHQSFEKSIDIYQALAPESIEAAKTYGRLGTLYRVEGQHQKAEELFLKSINIYNQYPSSYHPLDMLISLGLNARDVGKYKQALDYLNRNLASIKDKHDPWYFWTLSYLGTVYLDVGNYDKAWACFQKADAFFNTIPETQGVTVPSAWRLGYMGATQSMQGRVDEALQTLNKSNTMFSELTAGKEMHGICFKTIMPYKAYAYMQKDKLVKAKELYTESLKHADKYYGVGHFQTGRIMCGLGMVALKEHRLDEAETLMQKGYDIFNNYQHTDVFIPLEGLADVYYERYVQEVQTKAASKSGAYGDKSKEYLLNAYEVAKGNFPPDSEHIKRLKYKMNQRTF